MRVPRSFPVPKRVPTRVFAETPQRTNQSVPCRVTQVEKNREERKVVDEREISMDYVAIPASYEHPGFEPTPRLLQAGWLSTIARRRCAKREGAEKPAAGTVAYTLGGGHGTYAPRDEAPVHFQYATLTICYVTATKPTTIPRPVHLAG